MSFTIYYKFHIEKTQIYHTLTVNAEYTPLSEINQKILIKHYSKSNELKHQHSTKYPYVHQFYLEYRDFETNEIFEVPNTLIRANVKLVVKRKLQCEGVKAQGQSSRSYQEEFYYPVSNTGMPRSMLRSY